MHEYALVSKGLTKSMLTVVLFAAMMGGIIQPRADSGVATNAGRVLIVQHPGATRAFAPDSGAVREMVRESILRFTLKATVKQAWLSLVSTQDTIGLKVHSAPGRTSGTRPAVA